MTSDHRSSIRPESDQILTDIADYVINKQSASELAIETAYYCLLDTLGCGFLALNYSACTKLLGPIVPGATLANGAKVPGTNYQLEPVQAAFNIGAMIRWLDYNDTWLAQEWGHPSDNLGGILAITDYLSRQTKSAPFNMKDVLLAMIKAHEIQGVLALNHSFNRVGLDHVLLVRIATTAVVTQLLGGSRQQIIDALSNAWIDGGALRTYRHAPNTGSRKSWAAGDATSRGVRLALIAMKNEMGYPSALSAKTWGFEDVLFKGKNICLEQELDEYVMNNILFKISYPAEFHAQTAAEAAIHLHPAVKDRFDEIEKIIISTQESAVRIIDKTGPLDNPADRDHCLQYITAIGLLKGSLAAEDYEDSVAQLPLVDKLRSLMIVEEDPRYSEEYLAADKRAIGNAVQVFFKDGTHTDKIAIDYPIGHRERRAEGIPLLIEKWQNNLATHFSPEQCDAINTATDKQDSLLSLSVNQFTALFMKS